MRNPRLQPLRTHPLLLRTLRLLRLQHLRHRRLRRRHRPGYLRRRRHRRNPLRRPHPRSLRRRKTPHAHRLLRRRHPHQTARQRPRTHPTGSHRRIRPRRRRRSHHRSEPRLRHPRGPADPQGRRLHPRFLRHAVRRTRGATGARPHPHAVERAEGRRLGQGGRPAGIRGPDLRLAGGEPAAVEAERTRRDLLRARPHFGVLADCGGRNQACRADSPRRVHHARRRPHGGHVPARRRAAHRSRL